MMQSEDVFRDYAFFKLFAVSEKQNWKISDIPWDKIEKERVSPATLRLVRESIFSELTTYSATKEFMNLFAEDLDFTHWLSVWFYEETKHPHVLMRWISHFGERFDDQFVHRGRQIHPMRPDRMEMLCMNIVSEITAANEYQQMTVDCEEPVLKIIARHLSIDESRHAAGFFAYARKMIQDSSEPDRLRLAALRIIFYCLFSQEQHHPVNEYVKRARQDASQAYYGLDYPPVHRMLLHKFSQLTDLELTGQDDIMRHIQRLR
jgi:hypothetical protein